MLAIATSDSGCHDKGNEKKGHDDDGTCETSQLDMEGYGGKTLS